MPEPYDREGLIDRATDAINGGQPTLALEIAEEIRKGEGPNADEALIRGIALSSLGRTAEASDAFAEATRRAPKSHKAKFNAAVHEFNAGNIEGARALANEALALDPAHGGTRKLVEKITTHGQPEPDVTAPPLLDPPAVAPSPYPRGAAEYAPFATTEEPALPWIGRLGSWWVGIAGVICTIAFLTFVATTAISFREGGLQSGRTIEEALRQAEHLQKDPIYLVTSIVSTLMGVAAIFWTVLDLVRRRGNFLWLFAIVPCSCLSISWIVLPLYLVFGRKS